MVQLRYGDYYPVDLLLYCWRVDGAPPLGGHYRLIYNGRQQRAQPLTQRLIYVVDATDVVTLPVVVVIPGCRWLVLLRMI